jgi:hypothetical protein
MACYPGSAGPVFGDTARIAFLAQWRSAMTGKLRALIEAARKVPVTAEEREQQRRSFAYGNTAFENNRITREMVDREAEKLVRDKSEKHD